MGSAAPLPCPNGTWANQNNMSACTTCPVGHLCPARSIAPVPCPSATFNNIQGQFNLASCQTCVPGTYSWQGQAGCGICHVGSYCLLGIATVCPVGTYNSRNGMTALSDCLPCPAGRYNPGVNATLNQCQWCTQGNYCPVGSSIVLSCPAGTYCPTNATAPTGCPQGTYSTQLQATAVTACTPCTAGSFCRYGSSSATQNQCPAGFYCPTGTGNATVVVCPRGGYCPAGSPMFLSCTPGNFSAVTGQAACTSCPAGNWCPFFNMTTSFLCLGGYNPNTGASLPSACLSCNGLHGGTTYHNRGAPAGATALSQCTVCCTGCYCGNAGNGDPLLGYDQSRPVIQYDGVLKGDGGNYASWNWPCARGTWSNVVYVDTVATPAQTPCRPCPTGYLTTVFFLFFVVLKKNYVFIVARNAWFLLPVIF
jgi:hypothetical protein